MAEEFSGDLAGSEFWGADLAGSVFRDVNLTGARISHAWLVDVDIDALIDRVVVNGVDVTDYVNERDPWYPLRAMIRPDDPDGMRAAWAALDTEWTATIARAREFTDAQAHESVGGEWSFVQTVQHLVFAMDKWFTVPVTGGGFHPLGLPNTGSRDFGWPGIDLDSAPSLDEALDARAGRGARLRDYLDGLDAAELTRTVEVLENGANPVQECLFTVFEEEFWHNRYAVRDLDLLAPPQG